MRLARADEVINNGAFALVVCRICSRPVMATTAVRLAATSR
jgi:hypothetical protein